MYTSHIIVTQHSNVRSGVIKLETLLNLYSCPLPSTRTISRYHRATEPPRLAHVTHVRYRRGASRRVANAKERSSGQTAIIRRRSSRRSPRCRRFLLPSTATSLLNMAQRSRRNVRRSTSGGWRESIFTRPEIDRPRNGSPHRAGRTDRNVVATLTPILDEALSSCSSLCALCPIIIRE